MKKDTVYAWLERQRRLASKEKESVVRLAKLAAIGQAGDWLFQLTWAQMRTPLQNKCQTIQAEGGPLVEKQKREKQLTEQEALRLAVLLAEEDIYGSFLTKITPTACRAESDVQQQQREKTERAAARQKGR